MDSTCDGKGPELSPPAITDVLRPTQFHRDFHIRMTGNFLSLEGDYWRPTPEMGSMSSTIREFSPCGLIGSKKGTSSLLLFMSCNSDVNAFDDALRLLKLKVIVETSSKRHSSK